jgi:anti-sigma-K factor RskA
MNHEELKNSVAAYCLGALDEEERTALESHLQSGCAECEASVLEMQQVVDMMPFAAPATPPPEQVKKHLMAEIQKEARQANAVVSPTSAQLDDSLVQKLERLARNWRRTSWGVASGLVLTVLGFLWYTQGLHKDNRMLENQLDMNKAVIRELRTELNEKEEVLQILKQPKVWIVDLDGQQVSPESKGRVLLARDDTNAVFVALNLPDPPQDKDYQLWMIEGANPVDAGIVPRQEDGSYLLTFPLIPDRENIAAFAVTLEPKGGVPQPTGSMYLLGTNSGD